MNDEGTRHIACDVRSRLNFNLPSKHLLPRRSKGRAVCARGSPDNFFPRSLKVVRTLELRGPYVPVLELPGTKTLVYTTGAIGMGSTWGPIPASHEREEE